MIGTPDTRSVPGPAGRLSVSLRGDPDREGTLVLVHPVNAAGSVWAPVMARLSHPCLAVDLRGHGRSVLAGPYTVDGYLADVLAVLEAIAPRRVHLAGGSLGGTVALLLAARHPERVLSVTTFGSTLGTGSPPEAIEEMVEELMAKGTERYFADLVRRVVGAGSRARPEVLDALCTAAGGRPEPVVAAVLRAAFGADIRGHLAGLRAPVSAVAGTEDPTCPPEMTEEIAAATGGRVTLLDGVGHLPMVEAPDRVAELITEQVRP
jgi:pimeloyl-ACP methyl ester carboxylesterase